MGYVVSKSTGFRGEGYPANRRCPNSFFSVFNSFTAVGR